MRGSLFLGFAIGLTALVGCGGASPPRSDAPNAAKQSRFAGMAERKAVEAPAQVEVAPADVAPAAPDKVAVPLQRRIIYTADLRLIVEDFPEARSRLEQLVKEQKGAFVAHADISGSPGSPRSGNWTVRVPVEQLETFMAEAAKLGEVQRSSLDAQDVTEEFYDVEADIRNKKVEEEAFLNLEKSAVKYEDILSAKREVSRVRNEIDRLQKRLNVLASLSALSTVNIHIFERGAYVPETTPGFGTTIGRTFAGSLDALGSFGKLLVLVVVAVAPWLAVLGVCGTPLVWLVRRGRKSSPPPIEQVVAAEATPVAADPPTQD